MKFIGAVFLFVLLLIIQVRFFALTPPYEVIYSLNTSTLIVNPVLKFANLIVFSVNVTKSVYNLSNQPEEMSLPQNTEAIVYNINKGNLTFEGEISVTLLNNKIIINSTPQLIRVIINQSNFSRLIWVGYLNTSSSISLPIYYTSNKGEIELQYLNGINITNVSLNFNSIPSKLTLKVVLIRDKAIRQEPPSNLPEQMYYIPPTAFPTSNTFYMKFNYTTQLNLSPRSTIKTYITEILNESHAVNRVLQFNSSQFDSLLWNGLGKLIDVSVQNLNQVSRTIGNYVIPLTYEQIEFLNYNNTPFAFIRYVFFSYNYSPNKYSILNQMSTSSLEVVNTTIPLKPSNPPFSTFYIPIIIALVIVILIIILRVTRKL